MPETVSLWPSDVAEMMALFKDVRFHMQPENPDNKHDQIGYLAIAAELRAAEMTATGNNSNSAPSSVPVGYFPKPEKKPVLMTLLGYPITQIINSTGDAFPEGCEQGEYLAVKRGDTDYSIFKFVKEYGVWDYITECYVPASRIYSDHLCSCLVSQTKDGKFEPLFPKKFKPNPSYNFFPRNAFDGDMIAAEVLMGPGTSNLQTKFFRYVSEGDEWVEIRSQPATT
ncbi:hypothetical protein HUU40_00035 [candidate division KSB1 bacterium]|nr:hypothetical protein [candidate division KSB1 bacterium]